MMSNKTCSKGHMYDSDIYSDNCPFCSTPVAKTEVNKPVGDARSGNDVNPDFGEHAKVNDGTAASIPTVPVGSGNVGDGVAGGGTIITPRGGGNGGSFGGKKIVGLFATYDTTPSGQVFNIYEGRNYIGRDATNNVCIQGDSQVSGRHLSVVYREVDKKFKFKDELSSNGTFLNDVLSDEGELNNFDVIRAGSTRLVFIAIPQVGKQ